MSELALVCPRCQATLSERPTDLACRGCRTVFDVVDGVPILLPESLSRQQTSQTRYFDSEFERYPSTHAPENWRLSFIRRIVDSLGMSPAQGPYLDVGVGGSGATVIEAARAGVDAVGCDLSVPGVLNASRLAREQGVDERARFVACAAESLPFADSSFGCASAVAVLEHLDDDARGARELARVVRPGGLVWITVPLAYRYILPPLWPVYLLHDRKLGHKRHYDATGLSTLLGPTGFEHVETTYTGHAVKVLQLGVEPLPLGGGTRDRLWWFLERLDLRAVGRAYGALQLNAVFRREAPT